MVRAFAAIAVLSLVFGAAPSAAACSGTRLADLDACAAVDLKRADAAMNAAYATLLKGIGPKAQQGLKEAQRAWLPYRDRSCGLEASGTEGGSAQPMVRAGCLTALTEERTRRLNGYLSCREGDLSCVGRLTE